MVDEVLEHHDPAGAGQDVARRGSGTLKRGERAAVDVEAGERLDRSRRAGSRRVGGLQHVGERLSQRGASRKDRGAWPAATARRMTFSPSAR